MMYRSYVSPMKFLAENWDPRTARKNGTYLSGNPRWWKRYKSSHIQYVTYSGMSTIIVYSIVQTVEIVWLKLFEAVTVLKLFLDFDIKIFQKIKQKVAQKGSQSIWVQKNTSLITKKTKTGTSVKLEWKSMDLRVLGRI